MLLLVMLTLLIVNVTQTIAYTDYNVVYSAATSFPSREAFYPYEWMKSVV